MNHKNALIPENLPFLLNALVGGDHLGQKLLRDHTPLPAKFPPYDIMKLSYDRYQIVVALAGYRPEDITITAKRGSLSLESAGGDADTDSVSFLHRGIAKRRFKLDFQLIDELEVRECRMKDGMLTIDLDLILPEEDRPRLLEIKTL